MKETIKFMSGQLGLFAVCQLKGSVKEPVCFERDDFGK